MLTSTSLYFDSSYSFVSIVDSIVNLCNTSKKKIVNITWLCSIETIVNLYFDDDSIQKMLFTSMMKQRKLQTNEDACFIVSTKIENLKELNKIVISVINCCYDEHFYHIVFYSD